MCMRRRGKGREVLNMDDHKEKTRKGPGKPPLHLPPEP